MMVNGSGQNTRMAFPHPHFLHLALKMVNFSCGTSPSQFLPINMSTFLLVKCSVKGKSIFLPCLP